MGEQTFLIKVQEILKYAELVCDMSRETMQAETQFLQKLGLSFVMKVLQPTITLNLENGANHILLDVNMEDASLIALIENLQRRDLDFIEEAVGLSRLIRMFGMSQEEAAKRIGKSQSAVANKLRLLKLPRDVLENLRSYGLSERHGRALLRLTEPNAQRMALEYIAANSLTVAATEEYIEALLTTPAEEPEKPEPRHTLILKDVRVFLNSLNRSLDLMKQGGIDAGVRREETEDSLILTISIPKNRAPAP